MNDETDMHPVGDDALEARIVAWVLGEASAFEASELEKRCAEDPALRLFETRMRVLHGQIQQDHQAGPDAEWKLSAERRAKIEALLTESEKTSGTDAVPPRRPMQANQPGRRTLLAIAACTVIGLTTWSVMKSGDHSSRETLAPQAKSQQAKARPSREEGERNLSILRQAVAKQEEAVEAKRKLLAKVIRTDGIIYAGDQSALPNSRGFDAADRSEAAGLAYSELEKEKLQLESEIETLSKYDGPKLMAYAAGVNLPDNVLPTLQPELAEAERQLKILEDKGFASDHPEVVAQTAHVQRMKKDMNEAVVNIRETLAAKLQLSKAELSRLKSEMDSEDNGLVMKGISTQGFEDAKSDFEESQRILEQLKTNLVESEAASMASDQTLALNEGISEGVPIKKNVNSYSQMWSDSPFTSKPPAAAPAAEVAIPAASEPESLASIGGPEIRSRAVNETKDALGDGPLGAALESAAKPAAAPAEAAPILAKRMEALADDGVDHFAPETAAIAGGLRSGDGGIAWNDNDAILNSPEGTTGKKLSNGRESTTWMSRDESDKTAGATAVPGQADARVGYALVESGAKEQPAEFGSLQQMGELADNLGSEARDSMNLFYRDSTTGTVSGNVEDLVALGRLQEQTRFGRQAGDMPIAEAESKFAFELDADSDGLGLDQQRGGLQRDLSLDVGPTTDDSEFLSGERLTESRSFGLLPAEPNSPAGSTATPEAADPFADSQAELLADVEKAWDVSLPQLSQEKLERGEDSLAEEQAPTDEVRRRLHTAEGSLELGRNEEAKREYEEVLRADPNNKAARRGLERVAKVSADYYRAAYDQTRAELLAEADKYWESSVPPLVQEDRKKDEVSPPRREIATAVPDPSSELETLLAYDVSPPSQKDGYSSMSQKQQLRRQNAVAESDRLRDEGRAAYSEGKYSEAYRKYVESLQLLPEAEAVNDRRDFVKLSLQDASVALSREAEKLGENELSAKWKAKGSEWAPKAQVTVEPTAEISTAAEPFSTFSLHVSDASFKLAKAAMERGEVPAAESIRPEEFYNAFDFGDPAPANGEPVVCAVEQSAHPAFPQRNLLRIGVRTGSQGRGQSTPLNLTLLLDNSGSMERDDRQAGLARAVEQLSGLLKDGDSVSVIGFSRQPRLLVDRLPGARAMELNRLIAQTPSEGGTNLEEGLKLSEELALRQFNPAAQNRVVLFTDGAANLGDAQPETLQKKVAELRQQGIAFDAAGFGADGLNDRLLERLTRNGNGRYYIVDRAEDADASFAKQLAGAFRPAAENVKVQVRFNPARVGRYKLIGFEEHRLQKEDFRNDAVDAAEMAAEEAGNALYQIEVLPQGEGEVGEVSVRFRDANTGEMVERAWTIPYEAQVAAFDQATPSIQLAGVAAFTAEKLRGAPLADAVDFQDLKQVFAKVKAAYPNSQPVDDLGTMIEWLK